MKQRRRWKYGKIGNGKCGCAWAFENMTKEREIRLRFKDNFGLERIAVAGKGRIARLGLIISCAEHPSQDPPFPPIF